MMNAVVKPYHEMCLNSSELIVPRDTYQLIFGSLATRSSNSFAMRATRAG